MLYGIALVALAVVTGAVFAWRRRPPPAALPYRSRTPQGAVLRFDSVTQLVSFCRSRYQTDKVHCDSKTGELLLYVDRLRGESFESLVVHFEGEQQYAVLLPDP